MSNYMSHYFKSTTSSIVMLADLDGGALFRRTEQLFASNSNATNHESLTKAPQDSLTLTKDASAGSLVYGEVTTPVRLFAALNMSKTDTFADLGSGRGQCVLAAAMNSDAETTPSLSVGVEFHAARHQAAEHALHACGVEIRERVRLACADALHANLSGITKAYICNPCFGGPLTSQFAAALHPSRAPRLERVATISEIPESALAVNHLRLIEMSAVGVSWCGAGTALYIYERTSAEERARAGAGEKPPDVVVDRELLDQVVAAQRAANVQARLAGGSEAQVERGMLRTALLAASF